MTNCSPLTVGDYFDLENGFAFKSKEFVNHGIPVIKIKNVKAGYFSEHDFSYVSSNYLTTIPGKLAQPSDLLISMSGNRHDGSPETWVGKVAYFNKTSPYFLNQRVGALRLKRGIDANSRYFGYLLSSYPFQEQFIAIATSSGGQANLSPNQIFSIELQILSKKAQDEVAYILGTLDDKIELNRQMNHTLDDIARALFRDWFVDFEPTRRQMDGETDPVKIMGGAFTAEKAETLAPLFPANLDDNGLPTGWEIRELRTALTLNYGKSLPKKTRIPGAYRVYGSGGASDTHQTALAKGPSVIVGRKGTVGSLNWTRDDFYAIDTVFYVTSEYPMVYCHRLLDTLGLETMNTDAAVPGLNRDNAYRQEFAFGGVHLINAYSEFAQTITDKMDANIQENQTLSNLLHLLLPNLMSGEVQLEQEDRAK